MNIICSQLSFSYKKSQVLENINININLDHCCAAIIGHNGAGKTTLINILCGILKNYTGTMMISGDTQIAYLPFQVPLYDTFTVNENLLFWFQLLKNQKYEQTNSAVEEMIYEFKIQEFLARKVGSLSSGEKKKVALACILFADANLIIMDEPFVGLDPVAVNDICGIIDKYLKAGKGFIITSHQLDLIEKIYDRLFILKEGKIVFDSKTERLEGSVLETYLDAYES